MSLNGNGRLGAALFVCSPIVAALAFVFMMRPAGDAGSGLVAAMVGISASAASLLGLVLLLTGRTIEMEATLASETSEARRLLS